MLKLLSFLSILTFSAVIMADNSNLIPTPTRIMENHQTILTQIASSNEYSLIEEYAIKNDIYQSILRDIEAIEQKSVNKNEASEIIESIALSLKEEFNINIDIENGNEKKFLKNIRNIIKDIYPKELMQTVAALNIPIDEAQNFSNINIRSFSIPTLNEYGIYTVQFNADTTEIEICTRMSSNQLVAQDDEITIVGHEFCSSIDPLDTEHTINTTYNLLMAPLDLGNAQFDIEAFLSLAQRHHNGSFYGENLQSIGAYRNLDLDLAHLPQSRNDARISIEIP